jgi:hypothetical protein
MTKEQFDAIRARLDAATPGPWEAGTAACCPDMGWVDGPKGAVCPQFTATKVTHSLDANDAELIANAPIDLRALLDEVERLTNDLAMARQVSGELCEKCGWAMKFPGEPCRCELLDEVERLHADPLPAAAWVREVEQAAFARGAEAMREAAVDSVRSVMTKGFFVPAHVKAVVLSIRDLPPPEDK